ncbi:DNA cytosine methyltransferase [Bacillus capparidis]|uniref:Cytosine-specific methyltransferase n=1 Tax=Bacillus capparidis TaxID=1840411 RepID=A0ABS4CUD5_9BACI|nr:DNA cytosine methyltransferase [Bacillus capparidis]MBP1080771.1 DNA (cytosine-5)-methyltransferase 1 [Bacillus capparidis]MED1094623.1 DNA cytosine methyltransferase [Bacillus capparidis]
MPYAIDLFCGAGGMSEGLIQAGYHILFSSDISEDVERTYTHRHEQLGLHQGQNTYFHRADISQLNGDFIFQSIHSLEIFQGHEIPEIDAIFGGPPCQGFSLAGRRKKNDPRNMLFREYIRVISEVQPKYVVMENVEGFLFTKLDNFIGVTGINYPDDTLVTELLANELNAIGYRVLTPRLLDASNYGVPQKRRRAIFIAFRHDQAPPQYPEVNENQEIVTVQDAISDLIIDNAHTINNDSLTNYQVRSNLGRTPRILNANRHGIEFGDPIAHRGPIQNHDLSRHSEAVIQRFSLYREGENTSTVLNRILNNGLENVLFNYPDLLIECFNKQDEYNDLVSLADALEDGSAGEDIVKKFLSKKGNRLRYNRNQPAPTVVTLPDDFIVPFENRIPTVRELARLQSFDDSFEFRGKRTTGGVRRRVEVPQYTQVGNAVPPLLSKAIGLKIKEALNTENNTDTLENEFIIV